MKSANSSESSTTSVEMTENGTLIINHKLIKLLTWIIDIISDL